MTQALTSAQHARRPGKLTKSQQFGNLGVINTLARQVEQAGHHLGATGQVLQPIYGSVSFLGKLRSGQKPDYQKLYHATEIRSRSAATRCTWMIRRRASETFWLI